MARCWVRSCWSWPSTTCSRLWRRSPAPWRAGRCSRRWSIPMAGCCGWACSSCSSSISSRAASSASSGRCAAADSKPPSGRRPEGVGRKGEAPSGGARIDALVLEEGAELPRLEHLADDVAAADELAFDIELRNGRPAREILDALADLGVGQHVDAFELDAHMGEDLHHRGREAALREDRRALHVED